MTAQRIERAALREQLAAREARETARHTARDVLEHAHADAARIVSEAEALAEQTRLKLGDVSDAELTRFVDRTRIEGAANAMLHTMAAATRLTDRFDAMGPWIAEIVETALRRILASYDATDLHRSIVAQALAEGRADWRVTLRVAPDEVAAIRGALCDDDGHPRAEFAALREILADPRLPDGACLLVSDHCAVDISIETQVSALLQHLRHHDARRADGGRDGVA